MAMSDRAKRVARSRKGRALAFASGLAEATFLPLLPDVPVGALGAAAPGELPRLVAWASAGSALGGVVTYGVGVAVRSKRVLRRIPLVTERMRTWAAAEMRRSGTDVLWPQPWTGVPFKVFGYQAHDAGLPFARYLVVSTASRTIRVATVGVVLGVAGAGVRSLGRPGYPVFVLGLSAAYGLFLYRMVRHWSRPDATPPGMRRFHADRAGAEF